MLLRHTRYSVSFRFTQYPNKCLIIGAEGTPKWHIWHRRRNYARSRLQNGEKSHPEAAAAKTGNRNMAKIAPMSSQTPTSYSTLYTLGDLSRLLLAVCRGAYCITPIIKHWRTCEKWLSPVVYPCRRSGSKMRYLWRGFNFRGPIFRKKSLYMVNWDLENFNL